MSASLRSESKRRMYRRRRIAVGTAALAVLLGGYCAAVTAAPLPALAVALEVEQSQQFEGDASLAQAAVDAQALPTAAGWLGDDQVWSNDDASYRIASLTKLITVLVALEASPVESGTDGPNYTLTDTDAALVDEVLAQDGTFAPVPVGTTLTTKQILELVLIPSANNYAISYANWVFGSNDAFVAAANDWLDRQGLTSVQIFEPSGLDDANVASAADIVRIARLALENPLVASIVSQSYAEIPGIGQITTTNRLLGEPGVIGVKTGTTFPSGYSLAAAKYETTTGRDRVAIAVTLQRDDADARANDTRAVLEGMTSSGQAVQLVEAEARVGSITTWAGGTVGLVTESAADTVLLPGESASTEVSVSSVSAAVGKRSPVGEIEVSTPDGTTAIPVLTTAAIVEPDFWWRFTHPGDAIGWYFE